jgi:hypothetical protein
VTSESDIDEAREDLSRLCAVRDTLEVQLRTAAVIARLLVPAGGPVVVVGGSAVSFYTGGAYLSRDVDLVTDLPGPQIISVLERIGFRRQDGAWIHTEVDVVVDFPSPSLAGDPRRVVRVETSEGPIAVIGLEDLLIDRLNAVVHWRDSEAREWCVTMLTLHPNLDRAYVEQRAVEEGVQQELQSVVHEARAADQS